MDTILKKEGYSQGSVGARMEALAKDPRFTFPEGDPGRAEIMKFLNARITDIRGRMPQAFNTLVKGNVEVAAAARGGAGRARRLWRRRLDRRHDPRQVLDQPAHDQPAHALQPARPRLSRGDPGPCLAGRICLQAAADPLACSSSTPIPKAGRSTRSSSPTSWASMPTIRREARLSPVARVPRLPAGGRYRTARQALDAGKQAIDWFVTANGSSVEEVRARSIAIARGRDRRAATRSATARSIACATAPRRRWGRATTSRRSTTRWCWAATCR
jgi:hypothetical protein